MAQAHETIGRHKRNGVARGALRARTNDVLEDFAELRKDMGRLAEAANKAARSEVRHAGDHLARVGKNLRTRAGQSTAYVSERVRERPIAAVGVTLGAGLVLGMLLARR